MPEPIVFQTEDSLWQMLLVGSKTFDMRRHDLGDERIYRLSWFHTKPAWVGYVVEDDATDPQEDEVSFRNKATGEIVTFRYMGMEFAGWATGWCAILLGDRVIHPTPE